MLTGAELDQRLRANVGDRKLTYADLVMAVRDSAGASTLVASTFNHQPQAAAPEPDHVVSRLLASMGPSERAAWWRDNKARVARAWIQRDNPSARMPGGAK